MMTPFKERVLKIINSIPKGYVVSYGQVALMAGVPRGARQVGWILFSEGPEAYDDLPWWRVINNSGRISIKNPKIAALEQKNKLEKEGIPVGKNFEIDIEKYRWRPQPKLLKDLSLSDQQIFEILEKLS